MTTTETRTVQDDLFELRNTKLPRHHRDAEDAMQWAADEIEQLRCVANKAADRIDVLEAVAQAVVDADGMDGKDTVRLLLELNRIGKLARAVLSPPSDNEVKP